MILNPTQLRMGDVVLEHGMCVKLDRAPIVTHRQDRHGDGRHVVYSWPGLVLNPDEAITEYAIPYGFLYDVSGGGYDDEKRCWIRSTRPSWTIQGNTLARVAVEREHVIGCWTVRHGTGYGPRRDQ